MKFQQTFIFPLHVQLEDLDVNGVVHHPTFLKYLERARYHSIKECGYSWEKLLSLDCTFVVSEIHANYLKPALIDRELFILGRVVGVGKTSIKFYQSIVTYLPTDVEIEATQERLFSLPETIFSAQIRLVCIDVKTGKLKSIPQEIQQLIIPDPNLLTKYPQNRDTRLVIK
ncbi:thioesterase family protein [Dendronalium sp. ChiSLP03b]|uniref:acyl-CoA thioesterase n=1 Tax=Dendronalium sp. ChiSLP03b TaxID=3075381 RepID=UPI002AD4FE20|nr:thioesterase family protein [Dendronalium sp. ChiSLP03b]MDZ8205088.1 thioesterase family protein [Dendronalium sp. ChiSLP03b]